jgi:hypothetical protein
MLARKDTAGSVIRIEVERRFDVSVRDGFDYITELANWPAYWPRFVRLDPASRWRDRGDRARLTLRMLGRDIELDSTNFPTIGSRGTGAPRSRAARASGGRSPQIQRRVVRL